MSFSIPGLQLWSKMLHLWPEFQYSLRSFIWLKVFGLWSISLGSYYHMSVQPVGRKKDKKSVHTFLGKYGPRNGRQASFLFSCPPHSLDMWSDLASKELE